MNRRTFLKSIAATVAGVAGIGLPGSKVKPKAVGPENPGLTPDLLSRLRKDNKTIYIADTPHGKNPFYDQFKKSQYSEFYGISLPDRKRIVVQGAVDGGIAVGRNADSTVSPIVAEKQSPKAHTFKFRGVTCHWEENLAGE